MSNENHQLFTTEQIRQRLASGTTTAADEGAGRQASGKVQTQVDDRKQAAAPSPDRLTLSQGSAKAAASAAQASRDTQAKDARKIGRAHV